MLEYCQLRFDKPNIGFAFIMTMPLPLTRSLTAISPSSVFGTKQTSLVLMHHGRSSAPYGKRNRWHAFVIVACGPSLNIWSDCRNDKSTNHKIELIDESPYHLKGSFPGPQGTPYEGGHFEVVRIRGVAWSLMLRQ
jgi:hypothetical protein